MPPIVLSPTPSCIDTPLTITTSVLSLMAIALSLAGACISTARASRAAPKEAMSLRCELERLQGRLAAACSTLDGAPRKWGAAEEARKEIAAGFGMLQATCHVDRPEGPAEIQRNVACWAWQVSWATCGGRRRMQKRMVHIRTLVDEIESMRAELLLQYVISARFTYSRLEDGSIDWPGASYTRERT